jgi:hypothetical protein
MRVSRSSFVLALTAGLGCVGQIPAGEGTRGPGGTGGTGGPDNPPPVEVGGCTAETLGKPRVWRLTHTQLKNTLLDGFNFSPPTIDTLPRETRIDGFANQSGKLTIAPLLADFYLQAGDELAGEVLKRSSEFVKCPVAMLGATGDCLGDFVRTVGAKLWRRPITDAEVARHVKLFGDTVPAAGGPEEGVRNIVKAMFLSPNFLYRTELGHTSAAGEVTYLTDYELASALSYMLWESPPDKTLLDLAAAGKLRDKGTLMAQARRMWQAQKAPTALHGFLQQWLQIEELLRIDKDPMGYSVYNKMVAADLLEESRRMLDAIVFEPNGDRSFKTLFTADYGFVNARTAPIYGVEVSSATLAKTALDPKQRKGVLTSGAFMAAHADGDDTGVVSRGRYFREEILCDRVPPPDPADAVFDPKKITEDMTNRERLVAHTTNPVCAACHFLFDGLGFAMENYDPIGRWRDTDKNKPIDPSGTFPLPSGPELEFDNFVDLVGQLSKAPDVYSCFASQYLSYSTGRQISDLAKCERTLVTDEFVRSNYQIDTLVMSVVNSPSFMARKN